MFESVDVSLASFLIFLIFHGCLYTSSGRFLVSHRRFFPNNVFFKQMFVSVAEFTDITKGMLNYQPKSQP